MNRVQALCLVVATCCSAPVLVSGNAQQFDQLQQEYCLEDGSPLSTGAQIISAKSVGATGLGLEYEPLPATKPLLAAVNAQPPIAWAPEDSGASWRPEQRLATIRSSAAAMGRIMADGRAIPSESSSSSAAWESEPPPIYIQPLQQSADTAPINNDSPDQQQYAPAPAIAASQPILPKFSYNNNNIALRSFAAGPSESTLRTYNHRTGERSIVKAFGGGAGSIYGRAGLEGRTGYAAGHRWHADQSHALPSAYRTTDRKWSDSKDAAERSYNMASAGHGQQLRGSIAAVKQQQLYQQQYRSAALRESSSWGRNAGTGPIAYDANDDDIYAAGGGDELCDDH